MKILAKAVLAGSMILAGSSAVALELGAGFEGSANVGVVSNYMWRGMSQTRNGAALQGGLDLSHSSGFYAGYWASNVNFDLVDHADTEQDFYAGYGFSVGDFAFDLKRVEYHYASADELDFGETHAHVSAYGVTLGLDYSSDTPVAESDSAVHYYGSYSHSLPQDVTFTGTIGQYDYKDAGWVGGADSKYSYYNLAVNKEMWGVNFGAAYTDSNVDAGDCRTFSGDKDYCGGAFVLSAVKTFK
jgi:uncharacterized protein (TIGR02001 family)